MKDFKILRHIALTHPAHHIRLLLRHKCPQSDPSSVKLALVMPRNCVDSVDNFCYICGEVTFARQRKATTAILKKAYHLYFGCKIGDQDKSWAAHMCCRKCATDLSQWLNDKRHAIPFAVLWFGGSQVITQLTATSVCCHLLLEVSRRK